jgi:iron complex transport system permease protein
MTAVRSKKIFLILGIAVALLFLSSMLTGSSSISVSEIFEWLIHSDSARDDLIREVVVNIRLPRSLASLSVGVCLALAGLLLQTLLVNDLAEPYTLGISGGATLGVVVATALGLASDSWVQGIVALIGALGASASVVVLSRKKGLGRSRELILLGLMISLTCGSVISMVLAWLTPTALQSVLFWMMGQFGTDRDQLWPLTVSASVVGLVWSYFRSQQIDQMMLGEVLAKNLNPHYERFRIEVIFVATLLAATSVATSGLIGFVGLIAPDMARRLSKTSRSKTAIPVAACIGACLLIAADTLSRAVSLNAFSNTAEVPAGAIVAAIGAPLLIVLLLRRPSRVVS